LPTATYPAALTLPLQIKRKPWICLPVAS